MKRSLQLVCINAIVFTMSLSVCALQPASSNAFSTLHPTIRDTRGSLFVFHTDEFWLNLHHFLYVLGRAQNKERDTAREAVAGAPSDQAQGFEKLSAKE